MRYGEWVGRGGGLCVVAFRTAPDAHPRVVMEHRKEEVAR